MSIWKVEKWVESNHPKIDGYYIIDGFFFTREEAEKFAGTHSSSIISKASEEEVNDEIEDRLQAIENLEKEIEHFRSFL